MANAFLSPSFKINFIFPKAFTRTKQKLSKNLNSAYKNIDIVRKVMYRCVKAYLKIDALVKKSDFLSLSGRRLRGGGRT